MKKLLILFVICMSITTISASATSSILEVVDETSEEVEGVVHKEIKGIIQKNGDDYTQVINILEADVKIGSNIELVSADSYGAYDFGLANIKELAKKYEEDNPDKLVIGGINGDFFNTKTGQPVELFVRDSEVVYTGANYKRDAIGVKGNGIVVMGKPVIGDVTIKVNDFDQLTEHVMSIDKINALPLEGEISVYFDSYKEVISDEGASKYIIDAIEMKTLNLSNPEIASVYGKGTISGDDLTTGTPLQERFVVVSKNLEFDEFMSKNNQITVQRELTGQFKDIKYGLGAWGTLVNYGQIVDNIESAGTYSRHPRTAFGVKSDGTVLLVTVDGRQAAQGMFGVELPELASIMVELGAETAYNLDGGGSTTMILRDGDSFETINSPSDGNLRDLSNALLLVTDRPEEPEEPVDPEPIDDSNDESIDQGDDDEQETQEPTSKKEKNNVPITIIFGVLTTTVIAILLYVYGKKR
ncbi:phosphodiester glycosidase family protein [Haloplasma contractile]|uniref:N-acetylglucosamine-1-phosphodiester alpha-N-acetylglucosaminidase protein n=1 Tax=Haloplasma contractile SSD-17B TaxID=1033810 RepID=F7PRC5_9MOLU|nr:phosphodiester glycosidase family protein [Haloplasma contractile]ERJ11749.1 N-acetylglucosamine-1-phosphodiester alpha-N-acetylglucosaminidase protein [Haloplasma contractile SSD-17B]